MYSLVRRAPLHAVFSNTLGVLFRSAHAPHRQHHLTSLVFRRRRFLSARFVGCASAMRSRSTASPWCFAAACSVNNFGDPRKRFSLGCHPLDSKRMLRAHYGDLGCTTHGSPSFFANLAALAPHLQHHEAARLSQEATLGPCTLSQRRCRVSHAFCPSHHRLRASHTPRSAITFHCASACGDARESRAFPWLVLLVPSLRWCDDVWLSFSSFGSKDEVPNVVDDGSACFDSCIVSSRAPSLATSSARSLPAAMVRPA